MEISAVIITGNEESKIADAILSVKWADEILVVDSESVDRTVEIAVSLGATVISRPWPGFSAQKQFGVDSAKFDWIFSLDADERASPELATEIRNIRASASEPTSAGFRVPRLSYYMTRKIRYSGWYPDWQLRLFDRRKGRWSDSLIHESFTLNDGESAGRLQSDLIHFTIDNASEHHRLIGERYAPLAARQMFDRGSRTTLLRLVTAAPIAFLTSFVLKGGFMDGLPGYCIARFAAHHAFLKHLLLWELQHEMPGDDS